MCLALFAYRIHPAYPLILAANRDEFYERSTAPASFWDDHPRILAGRDLRGGGTWLGITKEGRFSFLTNYRDPLSQRSDAPSRGELVVNYLSGQETPATYLERIRPAASQYNGFNLLVGDREDLYYFSNRSNFIQQLESGFYGLSNHFLNSSWPKVERGKAALREIVNHSDALVEPLFELLTDASIASDSDLPETGVGIEWERLLSPLFIATPQYGTRSSTVLLLDKQDHVTFIERTFPEQGNEPVTRSFEFELDAGSYESRPS